ncbi:MAG: beta-galactosidase [Fusicatenibacter sp.]
MGKKITIGTAYYPEHWDKSRWHEDLLKIKETGMTTLRIAELAWSRMEPRDGCFDLDWLEEFINMAYEEGFKIILGTPSEASPVWLRDKHPEVLSVNAAGQRTGGRGHHCHTVDTYRFYISRMTEQMVKRFGNHPAVIGWQIDNELRGVECYCEECAKSFRNWLKNRYGTIENLNYEWGTHFWSQTYNSWDEVRLPAQDQLTISTSQVLDFKRFISDTTISFQNMQIDIIKKYAPHQFVSHNCLNSLYYSINMYDLAQKLDFYSWDTYPNVDDDYIRVSYGHDLARSTKHDNYWMLEQKNGYFNGSDYNLALEPGIVRVWAYQDIAHGANGVMFYRWRANRWGQEQNPNGIMRHDGSPRRAFYEIQQFCKELDPISEDLYQTKVHADVAIIQNYSDIWAHEAKKQYTNIDHEKVTMEYYRALLKHGITADVIQPNDASLSNYKIVIAPNLMLISKADAENLKHYVEAGGHLIVGVRSGMKNENNVVIDTPWPGELSDLCGVTVDEFEAFPAHTWNSVTYKGKSYDAKMWADILTSHTADVLAVYNHKFYMGKPAVTRNQYGKGTATYFGVAGCPELIEEYLCMLFEECGLTTTELPKGVFMTVRESETKKFRFLINMNLEPACVTLPCIGKNGFTGNMTGSSVLIPPMDVVLIEY